MVNKYKAPRDNMAGYRFLNEGEIIKSTDEWWLQYGSRWALLKDDYDSFIGTPVGGKGGCTGIMFEFRRVTDGCLN